QAGESLLFIGIGYNIIGDWLISESGKIYFYNKFFRRLHIMSNNIYDFLKQDIYKITDIYGTNILE
ncbi:MAG: hypothetical protein OSJ61_18655, partial [Lachnospiraceae bacterium]|nr:hypothetical protein [Lachnospiraceae bacterium]